MKGLALSLIIFMICLALYGSVSVIARGDDLSNYAPRTLKGLLNYLSDNGTDLSFEKTLGGIEDAKQSIDSMKVIIDEWENKTFGNSDLVWYERVGAFCVWIGVVTGQALNFIFQLVGVVFLLLIDIIDIIVWILQIIIYFTSLVPLKPQTAI